MSTWPTPGGRGLRVGAGLLHRPGRAARAKEHRVLIERRRIVRVERHRGVARMIGLLRRHAEDRRARGGVHVRGHRGARERELDRTDPQVYLRIDLDLHVPREAAPVHHRAVRRAKIHVADLVLVEAHDGVPLRHERLVEHELVELVASDPHRGARESRMLDLPGLGIRDADEQRQHGRARFLCF